MGSSRKGGENTNQQSTAADVAADAEAIMDTLNSHQDIDPATLASLKALREKATAKESLLARSHLEETGAPLPHNDDEPALVMEVMPEPTPPAEKPLAPNTSTSEPATPSNSDVELLSISEDNTNFYGNDTITGAEKESPASAKPDALTPSETAHLRGRLNSYIKLLSYFIAVSNQMKTSALSRENAQAINIFETTSLCQQKLVALSRENLPEKEKEQIKDLLNNCEKVLGNLKNAGLQSHILSYGKIAPKTFLTAEEAEKDRTAHLGDNPTEKSDSSIASHKISLPSKDTYTNHYFELQTADHPPLKIVTTHYNEEKTIPTRDGSTHTTSRHRANLYFDENTRKQLNEYKIGANNTISVPDISVMRWANNVLNTFLADPHASMPLQFNFPTLPTVCMVALVLHAKTQGIKINEHSNFRGEFKISDINDNHIKAYARSLKPTDYSQPKQPGDYPAQKINKWEDQVNKSLRK